MDKPKLGRHWILDAYDCDAERLRDPEAFRTLLLELPDAMNMTRVNEPQIHSSETTIAALVLLAESHISLHAALPHQHLHADVFSCAEFDVKQVREILQARFRFQQFTEEQIER